MLETIVWIKNSFLHPPKYMLFSSEHECKIIVIFMKMEVTVRRQMGGSDTQSRSKKIDGYIFVYTNANHIA